MAINLRRTDGENNPNAVLTTEIVKEIRRELAAKPESMSKNAFIDEWAWRTKTSKSTIASVVYNRKWIGVR